MFKVKVKVVINKEELQLEKHEGTFSQRRTIKRFEKIRFEVKLMVEERLRREGGGARVLNRKLFKVKVKVGDILIIYFTQILCQKFYITGRDDKLAEIVTESKIGDEEKVVTYTFYHKYR